MPPVALGRPRTRILSDAELRAVWKTARAGATPFHAIVALLVLTGQRRGEIARTRMGLDQKRPHRVSGFCGKEPSGMDGATVSNRPTYPRRYVEISRKSLRVPRRAPTQHEYHRLQRMEQSESQFRPRVRRLRLDPARPPANVCIIDGRAGRTADRGRKAAQSHLRRGLSPIAAVYNVHRFEREQREATLTYERWLTAL